MSIFYNHRKRKPQVWIFIFLLILPVILIILGIIVGKNYADKKAIEKKTEVEKDIFS